MSAPKVLLTQSLQTKLSVKEQQDLKSTFLEFLEKGEYDQLTFGKDSAFAWPQIAVDEELRHVHMIPIVVQPELRKWLKDYGHRSRKTSSKVLVYVEGTNPTPVTYGLLDILDSPDGHDRMKQNDLIESLAKVAKRFRELF